MQSLEDTANGIRVTLFLEEHFSFLETESDAHDNFEINVHSDDLTLSTEDKEIDGIVKNENNESSDSGLSESDHTTKTSNKSEHMIQNIYDKSDSSRDGDNLKETDVNSDHLEITDNIDKSDSELVENSLDEGQPPSHGRGFAASKFIARSFEFLDQLDYSSDSDSNSHCSDILPPSQTSMCEETNDETKEDVSFDLNADEENAVSVKNNSFTESPDSNCHQDTESMPLVQNEEGKEPPMPKWITNDTSGEATDNVSELPSPRHTSPAVLQSFFFGIDDPVKPITAIQNATSEPNCDLTQNTPEVTDAYKAYNTGKRESCTDTLDDKPPPDEPDPSIKFVDNGTVSAGLKVTLDSDRDSGIKSDISSDKGDASKEFFFGFEQQGSQESTNDDEKQIFVTVRHESSADSFLSNSESRMSTLSSQASTSSMPGSRTSTLSNSDSHGSTFSNGTSSISSANLRIPVGHQRTESTSTTQSEREFSSELERVRTIDRQDSVTTYKRLTRKFYDIENVIVLEKKNEADIFGFHLLGGSPVYVVTVTPGTLAERQGLRVGDMLITVNGEDVMACSVEEVAKVILATPEKVVLGVSRSTSPMTPEAPPLKSGYLHKLSDSGLRKVWKRRWVELKQDYCLYHYKTDKDKSPLGVISLGNFVVTKAPVIGRKFAFKLAKFEQKTYHFAAKNDEEMNAWAHVLTKAAETRAKTQFTLASGHNIAIPALSIKAPDCSGHMTKQGHAHKSWRRRYFVLKDASLYYYKHVIASTAKGVAQLHGYSVDETFRYKTKPGFSLVPPVNSLRTFYFYVENALEHKRWIEALRSSIERWQVQE